MALLRGLGACGRDGVLPRVRRRRARTPSANRPRRRQGLGMDHPWQACEVGSFDYWPCEWWWCPRCGALKDSGGVIQLAESNRGHPPGECRPGEAWGQPGNSATAPDEYDAPSPGRFSVDLGDGPLGSFLVGMMGRAAHAYATELAMRASGRRVKLRQDRRGSKCGGRSSCPLPPHLAFWRGPYRSGLGGPLPRPRGLGCPAPQESGRPSPRCVTGPVAARCDPFPVPPPGL